MSLLDCGRGSHHPELSSSQFGGNVANWFADCTDATVFKLGLFYPFLNCRLNSQSLGGLETAVGQFKSQNSRQPTEYL